MLKVFQLEEANENLHLHEELAGMNGPPQTVLCYCTQNFEVGSGKRRGWRVQR